ncbi:MAG: hypothetical protein LC799_00490 [Actinobacteria bacterium]|nr:hypothetical protein [Actinomycetota bacterium]
MTDIRTALRLDAVESGALGVLLLAFAGVLDGPLGLTVTLAVVIGVALLAWAGFVAWVAVDRRPGLVLDVIALNVAWVVASVVFAVAGWGGLTGLGVVFVLAQAAAVALLTALQLVARRAVRSAVAA